MTDRHEIAADPGCPVTGVVLAGGQGRRMGGIDKGLVRFKGRPLVAYALDALFEVTGSVLINANRNLEVYKALGCPVVTDEGSDFKGPLAGVLGAMKMAQTPWLLTIPCDCPLLLGSMLRRMLDPMNSPDVQGCMAHDGERAHPVFLLLRCDLRDSLADYLAGGRRKIDRWLQQHRVVTIDFSDCREMFTNVNDPRELQSLERGGVG